MSLKNILNNDANFNMLVIREPELYGKRVFKARVEAEGNHAAPRVVTVTGTRSK